MKRATLLLGLLLAVTGALIGPTTAAAAASADSVRLRALDQGILVRLNAVRVSHGLRPLRLSSGLQRAAVFHSRSMLEGGFFAHESADGSAFDKRVKRFYRPAGYDAWSVGENLLYSTSTMGPEDTITAWLESPAHRENMLDPAWREVGIGSLRASAAGGTFGGQPTWVVTMDFGVRSGGSVAAKPVAMQKIVRPAKKPTTATKSSKPTRPVRKRIERVLPRPVGSA